MSHAMRIGLVVAATLAALSASHSAAAEEAAVAGEATSMPALQPRAETVATPLRTSPFGVKPIDLKFLAKRRGGTDVFNDMQLKGVVADNRAVNVTTGNNAITDGAFAASAGVPMVVQNSGNNVLIQNATIISIQVK